MNVVFMTRHIKILLPIIIFFLILGGYFTMNNTDKNNIFKFYKAFIVCPDETVSMHISGYLQEEADAIFKDKKVYLNLEQCKKVNRIYEEYDTDYKEMYDEYYETTDGNSSHWSGCVYDGLKEVKVKTQKECITNNEWPFDKMYLINNKYLITAQEGWYFVFIKSKEPQREQHKEDEEEIIKNDTFTSPITTETHNFIPDDFFIKK